MVEFGQLHFYFLPLEKMILGLLAHWRDQIKLSRHRVSLLEIKTEKRCSSRCFMWIYFYMLFKRLLFYSYIAIWYVSTEVWDKLGEGMREGGVVNQLVGAWHKFKCMPLSKSANQYFISQLGGTMFKFPYLFSPRIL